MDSVENPSSKLCSRKKTWNTRRNKKATIAEESDGAWTRLRLFQWCFRKGKLWLKRLLGSCGPTLQRCNKISVDHVAMETDSGAASTSSRTTASCAQGQVHRSNCDSDFVPKKLETKRRIEVWDRVEQGMLEHDVREYVHFFDVSWPMHSVSALIGARSNHSKGCSR